MATLHPVILVVNAGSSSVKVSVYMVPDSAHDNADIQPALAAHGQIEGIGVAPRLVARMADGRTVADESFPVEQVADHDAAFRLIRLTLSIGLRDTPPVAIGHRVVHGGADFADAVRIDDAVIEKLEALVPLAPLHQPHNLTAIRAIRGAVPDLLQVACFDTAFHAGHDPLAQLMALPYEFYERGIRRYGFHGLSYAYIARQLGQVAPDVADGRVIVAHLGNGASLCAMRGGKSVESTMGLTALDGMPMGTRCGSIDPGAVLWLAAQGMSADEIQSMLYGQSGLKGISGISSDMRALLASDALRARLAVDFYAYRAAQEIGKLAVTLGGLDALVFTAGIGANSPQVRARICAQLTGLFGIVIDEAANNANRQLVSHANSRVPVWALQTDEEGMIALSTARILRDNGGL
ncbi:MAG: acetate kinase [Cupriavidus sp.]|uniref:acetate/propionate family kinase n=1 Tax=Cupriavidus pauculus TaxID=82633 RepID=UPI000C539654|nr:acetate/propionate family kinase [Cupriavidus pauculus]MBU68021.1 acetate kinase [Cupriavidus sp.]KAB0604815.1 acetate/propionate family kinase [Cupriavidus pauculus]MBY4730022.1 acetate/propionate family kinase [Cupriavidus pauculus]MCM3604710.1 acetate/propionate family kinase [Cupriavidus pauculus]UAK98750.1 acetate/propionate family kinase [Cupriavidus pauculus]